MPDRSVVDPKGVAAGELMVMWVLRGEDEFDAEAEQEVLLPEGEQIAGQLETATLNQERPRGGWSFARTCVVEDQPTQSLRFNGT